MRELKLEAPADLNRARSARAECGCLANAAGWLPKCWAVDRWRKVVCEIRDIERVEEFAESAESVSLFNRKFLGNTEILAKNRCAQTIVGRHAQQGNCCSVYRLFASGRSGDVCVPVTDGFGQIGFSATVIEAVVGKPWDRFGKEIGRRVARAVEIDTADDGIDGGGANNR